MNGSSEPFPVCTNRRGEIFAIKNLVPVMGDYLFRAELVSDGTRAVVMRDKGGNFSLCIIAAPKREECPLTPAAEQAMEDSFANDKEAHAMIDLINAEFQSDPASVACFDRRIVARVKQCVERRKAYLQKFPQI